MPVNDLIRVPDYNNIRNTIVAVMSTGAATQGYGQPIVSSPSSTGDLVSKTQFDNLRFDIVNAIVHQTGSVPTIYEPAEGELFRYGTNLPIFQYQTLANLANTNRFDIAFGQYNTANKGSNSNSVSFVSQARATVTVNFPTAGNARYFFNSGGKIRFISSFVDSLGTAQSASWPTLLSSLSSPNPPSFGGNTPAVNFYSLTSTDQTWYSQGTSGTYSMNRWTLQAKCNVSNNSSGTANQITFTSLWQDIYNDPGGGPPPGDAVSGTMSLTVNELRAVGALYPNLVPNSFNAPTFTASVSSITGS
jgi:hypothetical protein